MNYCALAEFPVALSEAAFRDLSGKTTAVVLTGPK